MLATALGAYLAEFGIIAPQGIHRVEKLAGQIESPSVPPLVREVLGCLIEQLRAVWARIAALEKRLVAVHRANAMSRRLACIPGVGPITAMAIPNTVHDSPATFFKKALHVLLRKTHACLIPPHS